MISGEWLPALREAVTAAAIAAVAAVPPGVLLARLPAAAAAVLAALLCLSGWLPLPEPDRLFSPPLLAAVPLLPLVALPLGWGLRRVPPATRRIAASLAAPRQVLWRLWLPLAAPWLLAGFSLGTARALAGMGQVWPAALLLAAIVWPVLRLFPPRPG